MSERPPEETSSAAARSAVGAGAVRSSALLASFRLALILAITAVLASLCFIRLAFAPDARKDAVALAWTQRWCRALCFAVGLRVRVHGAPPAGVLLAPNHVGYVDVLAIGGRVRCFFLSRADVAHWPLVGALFRMTRHIGIERERRAALAEAIRAVAQRLERGSRVCVFLEGTSGPGQHLLPFRASMVQAAIDAGAPIVPVGLRWSIAGGSVAHDVAYWGGHEFGPHAWRLLGLRNVAVDIRFGPSIDPAGHPRKETAARLEGECARLSGLPQTNARETAQH